MLINRKHHSSLWHKSMCQIKYFREEINNIEIMLDKLSLNMFLNFKNRIPFKI